MEHHVALHARDDLARWPDVDEHLLRIQDPPQRHLVGCVDSLPPQLPEPCGELGIAISRRAPVDALDRHALIDQGVGEQRGAGAQHAQRAFEQRPHQATTPSTSKLAATAAW